MLGLEFCNWLNICIGSSYPTLALYRQNIKSSSSTNSLTGHRSLSLIKFARWSSPYRAQSSSSRFGDSAPSFGATAASFSAALLDALAGGLWFVL